MPKKPRFEGAELTLHWAKENLEAIFVAYLMALFIRCFFIEVFQIPTGSMEPTLSGNAEVKTREGDLEITRIFSGDRIMATKFFPSLPWRPLKRFDVVIFRFPLNQSRVFIKRVVGLPGEELAVVRGNLYARPAGSTGPFLIQRKSVEKQRGVWLPTFPRRDLPEKISGQAEHPTPETNWVGSDRLGEVWQLDARFVENEDRLDLRGIAKDETVALAPRGAVRNDEGNPVDDMLLATTVSVDGTEGSFTLRIENAYGTFVYELSPATGATLTYTPHDGSAAKKESFADATLTPRTPQTVRLQVFDGLCIAELDGRVLTTLTFLDDGAAAEALVEIGRRRDTTASLVTRGLEYTVTELRLMRDIHYREKQGYSNIKEGLANAVTIPPDSVVVMGDNTAGSHDCRGWVKYQIKMTDGRVLECESIEFKELDARDGERVFEIAADLRGARHVFRESAVAEFPWSKTTLDQDRHRHGEPMRFIPRDNIIGTGLWVWWPKSDGRGVRTIR